MRRIFRLKLRGKRVMGVSQQVKRGVEGGDGEIVRVILERIELKE